MERALYMVGRDETVASSMRSWDGILYVAYGHPTQTDETIIPVIEARLLAHTKVMRKVFAPSSAFENELRYEVRKGILSDVSLKVSRGGLGLHSCVISNPDVDLVATIAGLQWKAQMREGLPPFAIVAVGKEKAWKVA